MKFLTFVEIDLRKIIPFLIGLYVLAVISFQGMFFKTVSGFNEELSKSAINSGSTMEEFLKTVDKVSLTTLLDNNPYPLLLMVVIGLALILFGYYLWYKEWFGASKRIYTLLSMKGSRFRIFTSKLTVFLFMFMAFYGVVLVNLLLSSLMMNLVLPEQIVSAHLVQNVILHSEILPFVLPVSLSALLYKLAFIVMIFAILSVFVLMDRSRKIWGMVCGFIYTVVYMAIFVYIMRLELFTSERVLVNWLFVGITLMISVVISYYLLKKKVSI
ncbi:MAG: hypothetical protein ACI35P_07460 [Bacillus sp. (in: firmicutes)]